MESRYTSEPPRFSRSRLWSPPQEPTRRIVGGRGDAQIATPPSDAAKHSLGFILDMAASARHPEEDDAPRRLPRPLPPFPGIHVMRSAVALSSSDARPSIAPRVRRPLDPPSSSSSSNTRYSAVALVPSDRAPAQTRARGSPPAASPSTRAATSNTNSKSKKGAQSGASSATTKPPLSYAEKRLARKCTIADCPNYTINRGRCFRHGGGKKCTQEGCDASAKVAGLCWKHGGSVPCITEGCERRGKSRGLCWAHGGGTKCEAEACEKVAVSNGFCWAHGGGKRCLHDGCQRPAYERTLNYCPRHYHRFEKGEETMEI